TRLRDTSDKKSQKYGGSKPSADAPSLRTETDDLRDWRYEIDIRRPAEYQDTTGACDEHESDQWRGQKDGLSNGTRGAGRSILPREYGNTVESAEGAEAHFPEDVQVINRQRRQGQSHGKSGYVSAPPMQKREAQNHCEKHNQRRSADVVDPFA